MRNWLGQYQPRLAGSTSSTTIAGTELDVVSSFFKLWQWRCKRWKAPSVEATHQNHTMEDLRQATWIASYVLYNTNFRVILWVSVRLMKWLHTTLCSSVFGLLGHLLCLDWKWVAQWFAQVLLTATAVIVLYWSWLPVQLHSCYLSCAALLSIPDLHCWASKWSTDRKVFLEELSQKEAAMESLSHKMSFYKQGGMKWAWKSHRSGINKRGEVC